ncbi:hypothetical protein HMPREF0198_0313 [Cardiobacterium hominis ATCC 15826]|uniref:Uncharacterized protein n=1 Tax=Cardiobacterium hominis (strain ATCC 15826 / DSM 8339 / NCTC 10426 / 6573) TaxID=638300 RepID=C8N736_CARH6|nr:hypothetical protein HMPREF0198_0313 [Cardiobacterium hominis ATCC 15826]
MHGFLIIMYPFSVFAVWSVVKAEYLSDCISCNIAMMLRYIQFFSEVFYCSILGIFYEFHIYLRFVCSKVAAYGGKSAFSPGEV